MKEHKGRTPPSGGLFLGFCWYVIGIFADRLKVSYPQDKSVLRFSNHSPIRDPDAASGFGHRVAFSS
ncbi:hypothetical protein, partial [Rhizobium tibeticum]